MGDLHAIRNNVLSPALNALAMHGVNKEDFEDMNVYPELTKQIASIFTERRAKIEMALGFDDGLAKLAIKELHDPKLLVFIARNARSDASAEVAMRRLSASDLTEIARRHNILSRVRVAARILPTSALKLLLSECFVMGARRKIIEGELAAGNY